MRKYKNTQLYYLDYVYAFAVHLPLQTVLVENGWRSLSYESIAILHRHQARPSTEYVQEQIHNRLNDCFQIHFPIEQA